MSKLQTYISERKEKFKERYNKRDYYSFELSNIESFNEETIEGVMAIVREWAEENAKEVSDPYPFEGQYIDLIILSELLQALNTKE